MSTEVRVWNDQEWVSLFVNDGNSKATVSLTYDQAFDVAQKLMPRAEFSPDTLEELRMAARMIRRWIPDVYPENTIGQVHFVRAVVESVASTIERAIDGKPPLSDEELGCSPSALVAAAPELLECLKDARSKLTDQSDIDLAYIDAVIAKATA